MVREPQHYLIQQGYGAVDFGVTDIEIGGQLEPFAGETSGVEDQAIGASLIEEVIVLAYSDGQLAQPLEGTTIRVLEHQVQQQAKTIYRADKPVFILELFEAAR